MITVFGVLAAVTGTMILLRLITWCIERQQRRREWKVELERESRAWQRMNEDL
jgi:hypothetical protein